MSKSVEHVTCTVTELNTAVLLCILSEAQHVR